MNVETILFWIRLIAQAIHEVLDGLEEGPGDGEESGGDIHPAFKPERIQFWVGIFARAAVRAIDEVGAPPPDSGAENAAAVRSSGLWPSFKPERIQFWLKLIARFVVAVIDLASSEEETGKSGEQLRSGTADPKEAGW